jgi:hypothetical protein
MGKKISGGLVLLALTLLLYNSCTREESRPIRRDPNEQKNDSISLLLKSLMKSDSVLGDIDWLQGMGTRFAFAPNRRSVALRVRDRFTRMGYSAALDSFYISMTWKLQSYSLWQYNVVAELRGSVSPDSIMILGAHYDDVLSSGDPSAGAPGANDNASGVSAMLEIARVMRAAGYRPSNTIRFVAFGAEEEGLIGSSNYAAKLVTSGYNVKIMVNNDMIACENSASKVNWYLRIMHYSNADDLTSRALTLCGRYCELTALPDTIYNRRSDSYPFYAHNIKSIYFMGASADNNYHTLNDVVSNCNTEYCTQVAALSCAVLVYSDQRQY